ncbi:MAG: hypothetical protein AAB209_08620 [Bacteroidota bacterium]
MPTQEEYWQALQSKICVKCLEGDGKGNCRIASDGECAIKLHFPKILEVINSVYSHSIVPYEEQLRKTVCTTCKNQSKLGDCLVREQVECALDRYFPLIVEVIEDTQRRAHLVASRWFT